jgi:chorismate dehydratase
MNRIKISAVSYINTSPFMYGINRSPELLAMSDISLDIPSICAEKLIQNKVDIGLVPVAALLDIPDYKIISDYCIGSIGAVNSVFIFSKKPIEEVQTLRLDSHSRTSNNLARVLLKNYWKKSITLSTDENADAYVLIGDRTFGKVGSEPYAYDLGEMWTDFTGLPFAFAVWAANKSIPDSFVQLFSKALKYGLDHRNELFDELPKVDNFDLKEYLTKSVDYDLTLEKRNAIQLFHHYINELDAVVV